MGLATGWFDCGTWNLSQIHDDFMVGFRRVVFTDRLLSPSTSAQTRILDHVGRGGYLQHSHFGLEPTTRLDRPAAYRTLSRRGQPCPSHSLAWTFFLPGPANFRLEE